MMSRDCSSSGMIIDGCKKLLLNGGGHRALIRQRTFLAYLFKIVTKLGNDAFTECSYNGFELKQSEFFLLDAYVEHVLTAVRPRSVLRAISDGSNG